MEHNSDRFSDSQKRIISICIIGALVLFCAAVTYFVGVPMVRFVSEPQKFRNWVQSHGVWSRFAFIGMTVFQVVIALVPGEPFEIGAGYAFGAVEGTLLCVAGITLGSALVFFIVRKFGQRAVEVFFSYDKIKSLKFLQNEKKLDVIMFTVFFLPGRPKDLLTYFAGLTEMKFLKLIIITKVARLPSVITSTVGGSALGVKEYELAAVVFAATLAISVTGLIIYNAICRKRNKK